jgi:hypothetical protein
LRSNEGERIDIVHWDTMENAQTAMDLFIGHPSTKRFEEVIYPSSIKMMHLEAYQEILNLYNAKIIFTSDMFKLDTPGNC